MRQITLLTTLLLFCSNLLSAQSVTKKIDAEVQETFAEHLGTIPALRHLVPLPPTDPEKRKLSKLPKKAPKNFEGRGKKKVLFPELQNVGPDPIRQTAFSSSSFPVTPLVNTNGLFSTFGSPHDPSGDIGKDHYVQAINSTLIGIYDKGGNILTSFSANTLWSKFNLSSAGDPIILYDQEVNRWLITEFPDPNFLLVAMSKTSDPMGEWDAWSFSTPNFPDYPKYGIWNNAYTVTTNEQGPGGLETYFINREEMLAGNSSVSIQRMVLPGNTNTEAGFFVATPVDWTGLTPPASDPVILALNDSSWGSSPQDAIEVFSIDIDWANPNNTSVSNTSIFTSPYDSYACEADGFGFACVPQKNGGGLDGLPEIIMNQSIYRNFVSHESIVLNFMTDVNGNDLSGIRWVELRKTPGNDWSLYQEGTFSPNDGLHRFMAAMAMDGSGNIGMAYNVTSANDFVGLRFTGRLATDPLGEMTVDEYNVAVGTNVINSGTRFGDYAHMSVDPTNDHTFWFTSEFATGGNSRTRILAFELGRYNRDIAPKAFISPQTGPDLGGAEVVTVEVRNQGLDTITNFDVAYNLDGGPLVSDNVNFTLYPDSTYLHTFTPTVDLMQIKDYNFMALTRLIGDEAVNNDTIRQVISQLLRDDAGITAILGGENIICGDNTTLQMVLTNFATENLTSCKITITLNGAPFDIIEWTGNIAPGESEEVPVVFMNLMEGNNIVMATTSEPNNSMDQRPVNDSMTDELDVQLGKNILTLRLRTDFSPEEITWEVLDGNNAVVVSGGPYPGQALQFIEEELCLDPAQCYTFVIKDSGGDGICCGNGAGRYTIKDSDGNDLINSDGQFGSIEENDFCAGSGCVLGIELDVSNESVGGAMDGVIIVNASNGVGPFSYSIDGGLTFQDSNVFGNLTTGDYDVVVTDSNDCSVSGTASVGIGVGTYDLGENVSIKIYPNPTSGVFRMEAQGIELESVFLNLAMFDDNGKLVYESRIARYDDIYTGTLSLYAYPPGVYFLKLYDGERKGMGKLIRIVRI